MPRPRSAAICRAICVRNAVVELLLRIGEKLRAELHNDALDGRQVFLTGFLHGICDSAAGALTGGIRLLCHWQLACQCVFYRGSARAGKPPVAHGSYGRGDAAIGQARLGPRVPHAGCRGTSRRPAR